MAHIVRHWADWISTTSFSVWLANRSWFVPTSQSIHIAMLAIVFGSAVVINLKLLGVSAGGRPISSVVRTLVPWMYAALLMLLLTGTLQTIAEPVRQFVTPAFWAKMCMIVVVVFITRQLSRSVARAPDRWDSKATRPRSAWVIAVVSLALWVAIIFCGRFIGYTWEFYA